MKNLLKGFLAQKILRHRHQRRMIHNVGLAALPFLRGRSMLLLSALALGAEYWRRRQQRSNPTIQDYSATPGQRFGSTDTP